METNELLVVIERGVADLRTEFIDSRAETRARFEQIDGRFERLEGRFDRLAEGVHELGVNFEDFKDDVHRLAEGVDNANEMIGRHREETRKGFENASAMLQAHVEPLKKRIVALEKPRPRRSQR